MCTAATYTTKDFYIGRTLDYEFSYGEEVVVVPRCFPLSFRNMGFMEKHYAMIGMAHLAGNYPMFYEAVNEKGLGMAGLNFVGNACYRKETIEGKDNVAVYEFILYILAKCATVQEARALLGRINLMDTPFSEELPTAQLHWLVADRNEAITIETLPSSEIGDNSSNIKIYDNPVGVMTNNPPFDKQLFQLNNYMHLSTKDPQDHFSDKLSLHRYSRGMGAMGLPGDLSSQSRFIRAAFVKMNSVSGESEMESVNQFFHILGAVEQQRGCCDVGNEKYEITIYTSCCNADRGIYYYNTYENHQITMVDMHRENLDGEQLSHYPLVQGEQIKLQN